METVVVVFHKETREILWLMRDSRPAGAYKGENLPNFAAWDEIDDDGWEPDQLYIDSEGRAQAKP